MFNKPLDSILSRIISDKISQGKRYLRGRLSEHLESLD
jgi:hypothetical protein